MESALQVSGESARWSARRAAGDRPRGDGVGVLYIAVQLVAQGILGSALAAPETAKAPLAAAAVQFAGPTGATLILIAMIVSTFGFMTATMLSTPRTLFALAVDGYLPQSLARVHRAHHTPHIAIAIQGVIVCAIAITGTYVKLAIIADVAILLVYLACCVGVWRLRRLDTGAAAKPFVMPGGRVVPWVAAALIVALLARATAQAWLLTGGVMAAASLAFPVAASPTATLGACYPSNFLNPLAESQCGSPFFSRRHPGNSSALGPARRPLRRAVADRTGRAFGHDPAHHPLRRASVLGQLEQPG